MRNLYLIIFCLFVVSTQAAMNNYDVKFYKLDLKVNSDSNDIKGTVTINAKALAAMNSFEIELDNNMTVSQVRLNSNTTTFTHSNNLVTLSLNLLKDQLFSIEIDYSGKPLTQNPNFVGCLNGSGEGIKATYTVSEPNFSKSWWPCKQLMSDKADSVYIFLTCPSADSTIANGKRKNLVNVGNGLTRHEWKHIHPINYWNISFAVGTYKYKKTLYAHPKGLSDSVEIQILLPSLSYYNLNKTDIDQTAELLEYFSEKFGTYPFANEKYGMVYVPSYFGGLENQTVSAMCRFNYNLISHELMHQWFGNSVSGNSWQDIFVHEGFGRYGEYIGLEKKQDISLKNAWLTKTYLSAVNLPYSDKKNSILIPAQDVEFWRIFNDPLSYDKGAALLHMIRYEVGDSLFFETLKDYIKTFNGGNASGNDLKNILEKISGRDFDAYFDSWYLGEGVPSFTVKYFQANDSLNILLQQTTSSTTPLFKMHVPIRINTSGGTINLKLYQTSNNQYYKIPISSSVQSIQFDPENYILDKNSSVLANVFSTPTYLHAPNDTAICSGAIFDLQSASFSSFKWYLKDSLLSSQKTNTFNKSDNYIVEAIDNNGVLQRDTIDITINPNPNTPIISASGYDLSSSFSIQGNQWYLNNIVIENANDKKYTPTQNGLYKLRYTDANACYNESSPLDYNKLVSSIMIEGNNGKTAISTKDGTLQLSVIALPVSAINQATTWSVIIESGEATIDQNGLLTAVSDGTVLVKAIAMDGSNIFDTLQINISGQNILVNSINLTGENAISQISTNGGTLKIIPAILPNNANNKQIIWSVINETGLASIDQNGLLTAIANGTVLVKAIAMDGYNVFDTLQINISGQNILVNSVTLNGENAINQIATYGGTLKIIPAILPDNANNKQIIWSVINETGLASIDQNGLLTAISDGTVLVKAIAMDGSNVFDTLQINISGQNILVNAINLTGENAISQISTNGGTLKIISAILPDNANNKQINWSVINETGTASIDQNGVLTAIANGTVLVKAIAADGSNVFDTLQINISGQNILVNAITLNGENDINQIATYGGTLKIIPAILPDNANNKQIIWSVINETGLASIDQNGLLTAIANGTVLVKAIATDGSNVFDTLRIYISGQNILVNAITLNGENDINQISTNGGSLKIIPAILPVNANNKQINWSVTNQTGLASIDQNGLLTAIADGTVLVKATAMDGSKVFGTLQITITGQKISISSIIVEGANGISTIQVNGGTLQMIAKFFPANSNDTTVIWSVENLTGTATISSDGLLKAHANGNVLVKATSKGNNIFGTINITLSNQTILVNSITVMGENDSNKINIHNGSLQMIAQVLPVNANDAAVSWIVINETGAAVISSSGLLSALANGNVTVKAIAKDGSGIFGTCQIKISRQITFVNSMTLKSENDVDYITTPSGTLQLTAIVLPEQASNKTVSWSIENKTGMATISNTGLLTAIENGIVSINATANDGSGISGSITINISGQTKLGIENIKRKYKFSAYPNPTKSFVKIYTDLKYDKISVINTSGETVLELTETDTISLINLSTGTYFITLRDAKGSVLLTEKIIKE